MLARLLPSVLFERVFVFGALGQVQLAGEEAHSCGRTRSPKEGSLDTLAGSIGTIIDDAQTTLNRALCSTENLPHWLLSTFSHFLTAWWKRIRARVSFVAMAGRGIKTTGFLPLLPCRFGGRS